MKRIAKVAIIVGVVTMLLQGVSAASPPPGTPNGPPQPVVITNTSANPSLISGTVGIDANMNTVKLTPTQAQHLANIDTSTAALLAQGERPVVNFTMQCHSPDDYIAYQCVFDGPVNITHLVVQSETDRLAVSLYPPNGGGNYQLGEVDDRTAEYDFSTPFRTTGLQMECNNPGFLGAGCSGNDRGPTVQVAGYR